MKFKGKYVILEKLDGTYRVDLPIGNRDVQGFALEEPKVGYPLFLYTSNEDVKIGEAIIPKEDLLTAWTSAVREIDFENKLIKTNNSTYRIIIKTNEN